ncbi:LPXTG cell wall anchor domain-containing protein, partial [Streptococcus suis]|uniref:LPXTG cell wall anchor domain-containing protein n=2 Tax=Streptococcus suis TaxID=1307 RepID=UPI0013797313
DNSVGTVQKGRTEVVNVYELYVNDNPDILNEVVIDTSESQKLEAQKPQVLVNVEKPQAPAKVEKAQLPNTGDVASYSLSIAGVVTLFT